MITYDTIPVPSYQTPASSVTAYLVRRSDASESSVAMTTIGATIKRYALRVADNATLPAGEYDYTARDDTGADVGYGTFGVDLTGQPVLLGSNAADSPRVQQIAATGNRVGPGANPATLHFQTSAAAPIANADVWITTDSAGTNTIAGTLQTDSQGDVRFLLDKFQVDGTTLITYYAWLEKSGVNPIKSLAFTCD